MKKLLPLLLALLLLAACGTQSPEQTLPTQEQTEPVDLGLYDPDSTVEQQTNGAVRLYRLERSDYLALSAMGNRLLLQAEDGTMTMLQGENCSVSATLQTGVPIGMLSTYFDSSVKGAAYYQADSREVVLVNPQLQETGRIALPEDVQGSPYISLARNEIFYCVPGEIRAINTLNGISRLIRSHSYPYQQLMGTWFDGEMVLCEFFNEDKTESIVEYISTDTGKTLYDGQSHLYPLHTWQDSYLLARMDGGVSQRIVGTREGQAQALHISQERFTSALAMGCALGYTAGGDTELACYELASGKCIARVTLPGISQPKAFLTTEQAVWILGFEGEQQVLCRWDITQSPANDDAVYTAPLITAENPDTEGLEACRQRAAQMSEQYGVKIHIWEDVIADESSEAAIVPEHQVQTVGRMLDELTVALAQFPEEFLLKTVEAGWIHINLVRTIEGDELYEQFWQDGDCYISLCGKYPVADGFYQGVAYAIDSHVLGNSRKFDDWGDLNPDGFSYSYSYTQRQDQSDWLGEGSAFLSVKALSYPHDDRASVFYHAMVGDGSLLESDVMQAKLKCMCRAIREAYGLEKSPDTYPWEQYLNESLAYTG